MLRFSEANTKLRKLALTLGNKQSEVYSFDLLAGVTCPYARDCKAWVDITQKNGRRIVDGNDTIFRCYAASGEARLKLTYRLHKENTATLKEVLKIGGAKAVTAALEGTMPTNAKVVRFHSNGGDFFTKSYFQGMMQFTSLHQGVRFYFHTKALPILWWWVNTHPEGVDLSRGILSPNVTVCASRGGTHDHLIDALKIREAKVILHPSDRGNLPIDWDDSHAANPGGSFCLLIHGTQPSGSYASKAWYKISRGLVNLSLYG